MKNPSMMQLTVEVGRCSLPALPYSEYSLSVHLNKDLSAATTFKYPSDGYVDFGTRLFLRMEKTMLESTPQCTVAVVGIGEKASRNEIARGEARIGQEGRQRVRLGSVGVVGESLEVEVEFCLSAWEAKQTKTNNMRTSNNKSHLSQKQSSCDQKEPHQTKNAASFHENDLDSGNKFSTIKASKSEKILPDQSVQLETSANTIQHAKTEENLNKSEDSELLIGMQIKIDQLQQRIQGLLAELKVNAQRLEAVSLLYQQQRTKNKELAGLGESQRERAKELAGALQIQREKNRQLSALCEQERVRVSELQQTKEQLSEMLILQQQKNNISMRHVQKLTKLLQSLGTVQEGQEFNAIEEKDEIIMLNEQLENELTNKNIAIKQMKLEIQQLKQKIALMQNEKIKKAPVVEPSIVEKTVTSTKVTEPDNKAKLQKKVSERVIAAQRRSDGQLPSTRKQVKKPKEKQIIEKKEQKVQVAKKPALPKNTREVKSPPWGKADPSASPRPLKGKMKPLLKIEQKTTMQSEKKSQMDSCLPSMVSLDMMSEGNNLMIHSRSHEGEFSKLQS